MPNPLVVLPDTAADPWKILGEEITPLARAAQTGSYEVFHQTGADGSGAPPHHHPWDEAFFVTEGEITIGVDGVGETVCAPGTFLHVPGGTVHWFRFAEGARMVSLTSGPGASDFFAQVADEVSPTDPDFGALVAIASSRGLTILPPPGAEPAS